MDFATSRTDTVTVRCDTPKTSNPPTSIRGDGCAGLSARLPSKVTEEGRSRVARREGAGT